MKQILMIEINGSDAEVLERVMQGIQEAIYEFEEDVVQYEDDSVVIDMKLYDDVDEIEI